MANLNIRGTVTTCAIATVVSIENKTVRISFIDQDDKAFGYIQYSFDEMPIVNETE